MRHAVGEGFEFLVGARQLARTRLDPGFERAVERKDLGLRAQPVRDVLDLYQPGDVLADVAGYRGEGELCLASAATAVLQHARGAADTVGQRLRFPAARDLVMAIDKQRPERGADQLFRSFSQ